MARVITAVNEVVKVPKSWISLTVGLAIVSMVRVKVDAGGQVSGELIPGVLTAVALALLWLPALIRVLAFAGGHIKTPAGEATTLGLWHRILSGLEPEAARHVLPGVLTALDSPDLAMDPEKRPEVRAIRQELQIQLAAAETSEGHRTDSRELLARYADNYVQTRDDEPNDARTYRMTSITSAARAVARLTPPSTTDLRHWLTSGNDGERVIALAVLQDAPRAALFDEVLDAIVASHSAFEQYQALGAMLELAAGLSPEQERRLKENLKAALADPDRDIRSDRSRAAMVAALLRAG